MTLRATTIGLLLTHVVAAGDPATDVIVRLKDKDPGQAITAPYSANRNNHQAMLGAIENRYRVRVTGPACATLHDALQGQLDSGRDLTIATWHGAVQARCSKRFARGSCSRPDLLADLFATYVVEPLDSGADLGALCAALSTDPDVHVAEPNHAVSVSFEPDDPLLAEQWALSNIGQAYPVPGGSTAVGAPDADIDAPEAWDVLAPGGDAVVAVLDTGVDYSHPDLAPAMWTDGGGLFGFDFVNNDDDPMDDHGHGTHCAGIIAAVSDNGVGVAGVCPNARIMALKFLDAGGHGYTSGATDALYYAVARGADVISNSWGGGEYSETLETAINYAHSQGVILVAAAGNADSAEPIFYPANYSHVLAIAATDAADRKAYFSNYGTWIDLSAPGVDILSLRAYGTDMYALHGDPIRHIYQTDYYIASGTSMACPHVAGGLALLMTHHPEWTPDAVIERLRVTTDDIALLNPAYADALGSGRLNVYQALALDPQPRLRVSGFDTVEVAGNGDGHISAGETIQIQVELENLWLGAEQVGGRLTIQDACASVVDGTWLFGDIPGGSRASGSFVFEVLDTAPEPHQLQLQLAIEMLNGPTDKKPFTLDVTWPLHDGWPYQYYTRPYVGEIRGVDLDQDGSTEVVVASPAALTVLTTEGELHSDAWPIVWGGAYFGGGLAVGDLDADPDLEILFHHETVIYAHNIDGSAVVGDWPKNSTQSGNITVSDLDVDGTDEVIVTRYWNSTIDVYRGDGSNYGTAWPKDVGEAGIKHAAVADLDGDGDREIVLRVGGETWGEFHGIQAYHHDGTMVSGWPVAVDPAWVDSAVIAGDVDGDGFAEIAFATDDRWAVNRLHLLDGGGVPFSDQWPAVLPPSEHYESISMADLNGNGDLEILVTGRGNPYVFALDQAANYLPGWPAVITKPGSNPLIAYENGVPAVGDVDGDGLPEVLVGAQPGLYIFNHDGTLVPGAAPLTLGDESDRLYTACDHANGVSLSDVDSDGDLEILMAYAGHAYVYDALGRVDTLQWPAFRHDLGNTGIWMPHNTPPPPPTITSPPSGIEDIKHSLAATARDPEDHRLFYMWDWGDGTYSEYLGPYEPGQACAVGHTWAVPGFYSVRVKAKDVHNGTGPWSESFVVAIHPAWQHPAVVPDNKPVKNRYISFTPGNSEAYALAFRVTITSCPLFPGAVGTQKWVGPLLPDGTAVLQCEPHFQLCDNGTVIDVGDREIVPGAVYRVEAVFDGNDFSAPVYIETSEVWADIDGNGTVNVLDVFEILNAVSGTFPPQRPRRAWMDLHDQVPDRVINVFDVFAVLDTIGGTAYPYPRPDPC